MSKLVLADGTEITIEAGSSLSNVKVVSESMEAMIEICKKFTADNLAEIQIQNDAGVVVGKYTDIVLESETSVVQADGTVATSFWLRKKTETELLQEKVSMLETDMDALNTAIGGE